MYQFCSNVCNANFKVICFEVLYSAALISHVLLGHLLYQNAVHIPYNLEFRLKTSVRLLLRIYPAPPIS